MSSDKQSYFYSKQEPVRALIVHPDIRKKDSDATVRAIGMQASERDIEDVTEEIKGLAEAIDLDVCGLEVFSINRIQPGAFLGKGQRQEIAAQTKALDIEVLIFNYTLSPVQQRNLEKEWNVKILDRTGLILEIFGARAQTKEGRLQVELAALDYQRSRLVRSWTHLERQRGGAGFMGGPGERQIEIDRRLISQRITNLKKELEDVRRTRDLSRKSRERVPFPVVALVGYTNAGKSTLFNRLSDANVFAKDLLFATLDPTSRRVELPGGQPVILSDTVGFIADLPTTLIAAFRATLEHINYADVIVHVMDASRHDYEAQRESVIDILEDLGIDYENDERVFEVLNKADNLDEDEYEAFSRKAKFSDNLCLISALKGQGMDEFLAGVDAIVGRSRITASFKIPYSDGKAISWLHDHADILHKGGESDNMEIEVDIEPHHLKQFTAYYGYESEPE